MSSRCFSLERYKGTRSRHQCPNCGDRKSFVLYVDEDGQPLDMSVGICNHESSCGYHKTPSAFYREHPELCGKDWRDDAPAWLEPALQKRREQKQKPLCTIPLEFVERSVRIEMLSDFTNWLTTLFDTETITRLTMEYHIGITKTNDVIYFQIDDEGRCRTGKIMKYNPQTGKRIKDENTKGKINWVHSILKRAGRLPEDWELTQCLYGEHLLKKYPNKTVALVESEKTAIICSGLMPDYVWLATGGKSQFNERLKVLFGRDVVAFPDVDGYNEWCEKVKDFPDLKISVSNLLQSNATPEDIENHIDIADWLIRWKLHPETFETQKVNITFEKVKAFISEEYQDEVLALIEDLDLKIL